MKKGEKSSTAQELYNKKIGSSEKEREREEAKEMQHERCECMCLPVRPKKKYTLLKATLVRDSGWKQLTGNY